MTISYKDGYVSCERLIRGKIVIEELYWGSRRTIQHDVRVAMFPDPDQFSDNPNPDIDKVTIRTLEGAVRPVDGPSWQTREFVGQAIKNSPECRSLGISWYGMGRRR